MPTYASPGQSQPEDPLDSPEVLMINALLEAPEGFKPAAYGVSKDMLTAHKKVWALCEEHQAVQGSPPPVALIARRFPDFELMKGVGIQWAAEKLRAAHHDRVMRRELRGALDLLNAGEVEQAREVMRKLTKPVTSTSLQGLNPFDPDTVADRKHKIAYPTPWEYLTHITNGGIGLGEFWGFGARLGQGKSHVLPCNAVALAEAGARVAVMTLEMPKRNYVRRLHKIMAKGDKALISRLTAREKEVRLDALAALPRLPGTITMFDPSDMTMDTNAVRRLSWEYQYVLIDHLGLMLSTDGIPAIKDWRIAAEISNDTKRVTLEQNCGVAAAIQINRSGEAKGFLPPQMHEIAGTDDIGRDLDVSVLMRRMGERSMLMDVAKNRDERSGRFYIAFEPAVGAFYEISKDTALDRAQEDDARLQDR